jgi:DNA-binding response OmpR family regulator
VVRLALEEKGYEVVTRTSPFGFGATLNKERPDLVLLDASMPGLRGDKLVEISLRHNLHRCPIVFYSDRPADELREIVRTSGAQGFIQKSSDTEALGRMVGEYLARPRRTLSSSRPPREG